MQITDAQLHIWDPETADRPWPADGHLRAQRHIARSYLSSYGADPISSDSFSVAQLLAEMDRAGVDAGVLVPPSFEGDHDACVRAAQTYPDRLRVMGRLDLKDLEWVMGPGVQE